MMKYIYILLIFLLVYYQPIYSQVTVGSSAAIERVSTDIEEGKSDEIIAEGYEQLAIELIVKGVYDKAENYFKKAIKLYDKQKNKEKVAIINREIAKVQEVQGKMTEAIDSYELASKQSAFTDIIILNKNDAERLKNQHNPIEQTQYISSNINLSKKIKKRSEQSFALKNMAQNSLEMKDTDAAIENLEMAKEIVKDNPKEEIELAQQIAEVYKQVKQPQKAIEANKEALEVAKKTKDTKIQVQQLQQLSTSYAEAKDTKTAISTLQDAYNIAMEGNNVRDVKNTLQLLTNEYIKDRNPQAALRLYSNFIDRLDGLLAVDSTLIDAKFFEIQEKRITQLEKERELKDQLISKQNTINYVLIIALILILLFILFIVRSLYSITRKNKKIALQSLRREMNPHFIFNSLNSINQFIAQSDELEANKYLTSYSRLMRTMMENSNRDFIPLSVELDHLKKYLDLEILRFRDKFSYIIEVDESLDTDITLVSNMLIQPQLENSIWHGLRYKEEKGLLQLIVKQDKEKIIVRIEDNGIGLKKSHDLKTKHQKVHNSRGLTNSYERINLLNSLYKTNIRMTIIDKDGEESGVVVVIEFPLKLKQ